jgi:hypothetical protein
MVKVEDSPSTVCSPASADVCRQTFEARFLPQRFDFERPITRRPRVVVEPKDFDYSTRRTRNIYSFRDSCLRFLTTTLTFDMS